MKMMCGVSLVSHALSAIVCVVAGALNVYYGNSLFAVAFLFFLPANVLHAYDNYWDLKAFGWETATKEEGQR